jgi:ribosome recycling factor
MSEVIEHLDVAVRLYLIIPFLTDEPSKNLCKDALDEIERLRAEVKKLRRAK